MKPLKEIKDELLHTNEYKNSQEICAYATGVLDMYNEVNRDVAKEVLDKAKITT
jgi:hypothetical protein